MPSLKSVTADPNKEVQGVDRDFHGITFVIARMGNASYEMDVQMLKLAAMAETRRDTFTPNELREIQLSAMSSSILVNWRNLTEDDQVTPIPYSKEKARELLSSCHELFRWVREQCTIDEIFARDQEETEAGN